MGILRESEESGGPHLSFEHDLLRQAVREGLSRARREFLHQEAFHCLLEAAATADGGRGPSWIQADRLARHAIARRCPTANCLPHAFAWLGGWAGGRGPGGGPHQPGDRPGPGGAPEAARCHAALAAVAETKAERAEHDRQAEALFRALGMAFDLERLPVGTVTG